MGRDDANELLLTYGYRIFIYPAHNQKTAKNFTPFAHRANSHILRKRQLHAFRTGANSSRQGDVPAIATSFSFTFLYNNNKHYPQLPNDPHSPFHISLTLSLLSRYITIAI